MGDVQGAQSKSGHGSTRFRWNDPDLRGLFVLCGGALLTALMLALILGRSGSGADEFALAAIPVADLDAAAVTMFSKQAAARIAEAKSCKAPMATLTIAKRPGTPDSTIRISSGSYVSPTFKITEAPQRIAVPFPAPFPAGRGVISVLGEGKDLTIWLSPGWAIPNLSGSASHNVVWSTKPNC